MGRGFKGKVHSKIKIHHSNVDGKSVEVSYKQYGIVESR